MTTDTYPPGTTGDAAHGLPQSVPAPGPDQLTTAVWIYDTGNARIHWANSAGLALWESSGLAELRARDFGPETSEAVASMLREYLEDFAAGRTVTCWWQFTPCGKPKNVLCRFSGARLDDGRPAMLCEGLLQDSPDVDVVALLGDSVMVVSAYAADGELQSANPPYRAQFDEEMTSLVALFAEPGDAERLLAGAADPGQRARLDAMVLTRDGPRWHALELHRRDGAADAPVFLLFQTDIHERKARELEHARRAVTDALTGLRNRSGVRRQLEQMCEQGRPFSLFYIDLDGFKQINDTFGHGVGDEILQQVAQRLETLAGEGATIGRIGGDEFVIAAHADRLQASPSAFATWIVNSVSRPYRVARIGALTLSTSVGIARFPEHGRELDELLANADTAMYAAKAQGRRRWIDYAPGMRDSLQRCTLVAQQLPGAGTRGELWLAYQPIVQVREREVVAVEALLRWDNPHLGVIAPMETVGAAEQTGLIGELEDWILQQAGRDLKRLRKRFGADLQVNVNVSGRNLAQPDYADRLARSLRQVALRPADLVLELSEASMLPVAGGNCTPVARLVESGHALAIDDFGTGYSCLAYLHQLPASSVKIDRAFVERLAEDTATIACIHSLVRSFGMLTVAEGVETPCQAAALLEQGVECQQGYLHGRPQSVQALMAGRTTPA